jgi:hypothetical protein
MLLLAAAALLSHYAACWSAPQPLLEAAYTDKLEPGETDVNGYVALDRFAPVPRSEARTQLARRGSACPNTTALRAQIEVVLTVAGVQRRTAHVLPNGAWAFHSVPSGTHALDVVAAGASAHSSS